MLVETIELYVEHPPSSVGREPMQVPAVALRLTPGRLLGILIPAL